MTTLAWSPRVGEAWVNRNDGRTVEIIGDHVHGEVVLLRAGDSNEWVPYADFERDYEQECCGHCGVPLTMERKLQIEIAAKLAAPARSAYTKATPGSYCTKPCCATRHAPRTC